MLIHCIFNLYIYILNETNVLLTCTYVTSNLMLLLNVQCKMLFKCTFTVHVYQEATILSYAY